MFDYDAARLRSVILEIACSNIPLETGTWFRERVHSPQVAAINNAFSQMPRKSGKAIIQIDAVQEKLINEIKPGYKLSNWTTDRLCRVCLLMYLDESEKEKYFKTVENLFLAAEMAELVALYSALPMLAYPEMWKLRCAEGIRSNMAPVLEALMYNNPYPAQYLDEKAWNQLVMKAFFTDKNVNQIYGLDKRANAELALILSDYAHERWAAGRSVNPLLWRLTAKFIDARILSDLKKVMTEGDLVEKQAAALTIYNSNSTEAKDVLAKHEDLNKIVQQGLDWDNI